jgi:preprotein translocase subunit Sec63
MQTASKPVIATVAHVAPINWRKIFFESRTQFYAMEADVVRLTRERDEARRSNNAWRTRCIRAEFFLFGWLVIAFLALLAAWWLQ